MIRKGRSGLLYPGFSGKADLLGWMDGKQRAAWPRLARSRIYTHKRWGLRAGPPAPRTEPKVLAHPSEDRTRTTTGSRSHTYTDTLTRRARAAASAQAQRSNVAPEEDEGRGVAAHRVAGRAPRFLRAEAVPGNEGWPPYGAPSEEEAAAEAVSGVGGSRVMVMSSPSVSK